MNSDPPEPDGGICDGNEEAGKVKCIWQILQREGDKWGGRGGASFEAFAPFFLFFSDE